MYDGLNDYDLTSQEIGELENADQVTRFFALLGYNVDVSTRVDHDLLNLGSEDLRQLIHQVYKIAEDPEDGEIEVYLFEVRSVTVALTQTIARRFRTRGATNLLILTSDYEKLDFVLMERKIIEGKGGMKRTVTRPRPLTINRRNPTTVARRVLKRFTYTEADSLYQAEKLRGAYVLAEWSEPDFNNRALFSDYYLKKRLTDERLTPEWGEDVRPVGRQVVELLAGARKKFTKQPEAEVRAGLYEPLFDLLGFEFAASKPGHSDADEPDYRLYAPGQPDQPVALALTYVWYRNLDSDDHQRDKETPDENPGAMVVSLLERGEAPWVIMTNGKLWRLYSATASNKATNYYEVDLEEALAAPDQVTALKYWWLLFRQEAFVGFLEKLLQESADYAKELGDRLKNSVFEKIFPHFAEGFIADMRAQGVTEADIDLKQVFSGTMTFLYRLMFILYAESLELVPINEESGYRILSLYSLKNDIAAVGDDSPDAAPANIANHFDPTSTEYYRNWLLRLVHVIDEGAEELNLPTYNGGLFSPSTPEGVFLETYAIPDQHLALGMDHLCRAIDAKTEGLVMIDFKSLGVRQLGSIYEGLLEFKLRIADEPLAVIKEKGTEVYLPLKKAKKQRKRVLAEIQSGEVYLENDKRERKATGSYYTPEYIVDYIVEHTVGPVLERKLNELEPRMQAAQRAFRQHADIVRERRSSMGDKQSPELFWQEPEMQQLADDCLNIRVLDPAMGSGHFLVRTVDYVSNKLVHWLNAWSENPVWAMLDQIRDDIVAEVERQHVTVDFDKLSRVTLMRRAVLKRCIYGVDLNPMAVELAKVSLWLDAFTLGAPLSFLDHHLKKGNSLIGSRILEAREVIETYGQQMSMFASNQWAGIKNAIEAMRRVSFLSDNTVSQVEESQSAYRSATDFLEPYKRILHVYTSRWFGNQPQKVRGRNEYFEPAIELLRRDDIEEWLRNPDLNLLPEEDYMIARQIAETAISSAERYSFFHWELEFPEVFFSPSSPGGQDVQLRGDGGFDVVVGNPPYDEVSQYYSGNTEAENSYFSSAGYFDGTKSGRINLYRLFLLILEGLLRPNGLAAYIIPLTILTDSFSFGTRKRIFESMQIVNVEAFPQKDDRERRVFREAKQSTCILELANSSTETSLTTVRTHPGRNILTNSPCYSAKQTALYRFTPEQHAIPLVSEGEWKILEDRMHPDMGIVLSQVAGIYAGEISENAAYQDYISDDSVGPLILRGSHVNRYELLDNPSQGKEKYLRHEKWLTEKRGIKTEHHREARVGYQRGAAVDNWRRLIATIIPAGEVCFDTIGYIPFAECNVPYAILALLNSTLWDFRFSATSSTNHINAYELNGFLVPDGALTSSTSEELAVLAKRMLDLHQVLQERVDEFLEWLEATLRTSIDELAGKTIIRNFLGDYQKGENRLSWSEFYFRLHQNRSRFGVTLEDVKGTVQTAYDESLNVLLPMKRQLEETDREIDKIVYRLYGLTDEEVEIIVRPQYERAIRESKWRVAADEDLQRDLDEAADVMAGDILPAARRYFHQVQPVSDEETLRQSLPIWEQLPEDVRVFLLTGEYNLSHLPMELDFSASVVAYSKAVETTLDLWLFAAFRNAGYTAADCSNNFFQQFMDGDRHLTLGSMAIIMRGTEPKFRAFVVEQNADAEETIFSEEAMLSWLTEDSIQTYRNAAAHDTVMTREDALRARDWALNILWYLQ